MSAWNDRLYRQYRNTEPFEDALVNPCSMDLRLGDEVRFPHQVWRELTPRELELMEDGFEPPILRSILTPAEYDAAKAAEHLLVGLPRWGAPVKFTQFWFRPGAFVLCHSLEFVSVPPNVLALLFSKSTTGRRGIEHSHAGLGDSGWQGQWTWELSNIAPWPILMKAGEKLMQHIFIELVAAPDETYEVKGRYQGQRGATPERAQR